MTVNLIGCRAISTFESLLIIAFWSTSIHATDNDADNSETFELPDLELIEFLGQWETDDGEWIDPNSLAGNEFAGLLNASTNDSDGGNEDTDDTATSTPQGDSDD